MVGEDWYDHLWAQIQNYENRQGLVGSMCDIPTPENFKLICCLVEGAEIGEARIMCSYFLSLLNTAIDRKVLTSFLLRQINVFLIFNQNIIKFLLPSAYLLFLKSNNRKKNVKLQLDLETLTPATPIFFTNF